MQQNSEEQYACPYCLTKINEPPTESDKKPEKTPGEADLPKKLVKDREKPYACNYHLGYLSERKQKQDIPDECLVCKDTVECILGKMKI